MSIKIGARCAGASGCEFIVWAPQVNEVVLKLLSPELRMIPMERDEWGYWRTAVENVAAGVQYLYRIDNDEERPDPASDLQPFGVHGSSEVVAHDDFPWSDQAWAGISIEQLVISELHVGAFTSEGTFDAIIPRLTELHELGITAIELMPVAEFPGERNWGYDGVYPFSVHHAYGGPAGLKRLVNACHEVGLAVILDVVYNHLGPEGNYLARFAPYFTVKYRTPWGSAINFDGPGSDGVRNYFIENALHWFGNYHIDGLRLDAIHAIYDQSARPFLQELADEVMENAAQQSRRPFLIAESNLNEPRVIRPKERGGFGLEAVWCDDFHHSLRTLLTADRRGYYVDFGSIAHLVKAMREGFVYSGEYSAFRKRRHGSSSADRPGHQFVVFAQNHDQIGNRMLGERLSELISFESLKLAAGTVLLSPFIPLLFMGEEYGEDAPFLYFVSHGDPDLISAVREGRKEEFKTFRWTDEPPDPQAMDTFLRSKIDWEKRDQGRHRLLREFYRKLIRLRREIPALAALDKNCLEVSGDEKKRIVLLRRWNGDSRVFCAMNFNSEEMSFRPDLLPGEWTRLVDSADDIWGGPGSSLPARITAWDEVLIKGSSVALYRQEGFL
jgi:maltooligosyltrehalose trehalohydrolase